MYHLGIQIRSWIGTVDMVKTRWRRTIWARQVYYLVLWFSCVVSSFSKFLPRSKSLYPPTSCYNSLIKISPYTLDFEYLEWNLCGIPFAVSAGMSVIFSVRFCSLLWTYHSQLFLFILLQGFNIY